MENLFLKELVDQKTDNCVSVFLSTEKKSFADKIDFGDAVTAIHKTLRTKMNPADAEAAVSRISGLLEKPDVKKLQHGVGIFVNPHYSGLYYFSFPVTDNVVVDTSFEIRDIIADLNKQTAYGVVLINKDQVRAFKGKGMLLTEIRNQDFPFEYTDVFNPDHFESGYIFKGSEPKSNITKPAGFLREVDHALESALGDLPLVLLGTDKYVNVFYNESVHQSRIADKINGSYNKAGNYELAQIVWPSVEKYQEQRLAESLEHARGLVGMQKAVSGIQEVWDIAQSGIGKELFVESGYRCNAFVETTASGNGHLLLDNPGVPESAEIADAVDTILEIILKGHDTIIHIVPDGLLQNEGRILLTTRY